MEFRSGMRLREGASLRVMGGDALYDNCLGGLKIGPGMQVVGNVHTPRVKKVPYRDGVRGDISMLGCCFRYFFSLCNGFRVAPAV